MTILGGLVDTIKDLISDSVSGVGDALTDNVIGNSIGSLLSLIPFMASPITLFISFLGIGLWLVKSSLLIFVVCEAFIMAFSVLSGNPLQNVINYNIGFLGGIVKMVHSIIKLFISLIQAIASFIP